MKEIPTTKGKFAIVDDEDYEWLSQYKWFENTGYAFTAIPIGDGKYKYIGMHRMIMKCPPDKEVDHINRERNDNRRENLRIVTRTQNRWNIGKTGKNNGSKYKGVSFVRKKYHVSITHNTICDYIGVFNNEIAAANAYNYYAKLYHGEYAFLNDVLFMEKEEWNRFKEKYSSIYKGVTWHEKMKKWIVFLRVENKTKNIAYFNDEIVAANYYNHIVHKEINKCEYVSLDDCEKLRYIPSNTSQYRGVSWSKKRGKWVSHIYDGSKTVTVGFFDNEEDAALAYNTKAKELNVKNLEKKLNKVGADYVVNS